MTIIGMTFLCYLLYGNCDCAVCVTKLFSKKDVKDMFWPKNDYIYTAQSQFRCKNQKNAATRGARVFKLVFKF